MAGWEQNKKVKHRSENTQHNQKQVKVSSGDDGVFFGKKRHTPHPS